jgi:hypothetical protein
VRENPDGTVTVSLAPAEGLDHPAITVLVPEPERWTATVDGRSVPTAVVTRHGHRLLQVVLAEGGGDVLLARAGGGGV